MTDETQEEINVMVADGGAADVANASDEAPVSSDKAVEELKGQFETLKAEAERDRQARAEAERRAAESARLAEIARRESVAAHQQVSDREFDTVAAGLAAAQTDAEAASAEYASAMEAGDFARAAKAQRRIANAEAKIVRLEEAKSSIEHSRSQPRPSHEGRVEAQQQPPPDPVEQYVANMSAPSARWVREHREYVTDPRKNAKLQAAHLNAVGDGIAPDTSEYFQSVERFLGLRDEPSKQQQQPRDGNGKFSSRKAGAPVAPVAASGNGSSLGGTEVRLTATEAASAEDGTLVWGKHDLAAGRIKDERLLGQPIGRVEFARRKLAMMRQGLYDKTYSEQ